jgi:hypothetical protein
VFLNWFWIVFWVDLSCFLVSIGVENECLVLLWRCLKFIIQTCNEGFSFKQLFCWRANSGKILAKLEHVGFYKYCQDGKFASDFTIQQFQHWQ